MGVIKVPQLSWWGTKALELPVPDDWQIDTCNMSGYDRPALKPEQIKEALGNPVGTPPIKELAKGKKEVVIIFDDMTRVTRTSDVVPFVLQELAEAGIPDSNIRFVCALGCHGSLNRLDFVKKLGEDVVARFPVYNHNVFGNCDYVGFTRTYGVDLYVNAEVMKCDLKIAIGSVVPHPNSGFGGGGKIIMPGVSSFESIKQNHKQTYLDMWKYRGQKKIGTGYFDENPMRQDIEESAMLAGLDVIINCLVNSWGETVAVYAGALQPAYAKAVKDAKSSYLTDRAEGKDIIISNSFAKPNEAWLGLPIAYSSVKKDGGDVVLIGNSPEGQVLHYLLGPFGSESFGPLRFNPRLPDFINRLIIFSEYPEMASRGYYPDSDRIIYLDKWDDVIKVLGETDISKPQVAVYPNADIQYRV